SYVNPVTLAWVPNLAAIVLNIDPRQGFIRQSQITRQPVSEWKQYDVDDNGQISFLSGDIIRSSLDISTIIGTLDGGYAIVFANVFNSSININDPFSVRAGLYAIFLARNQPNTGIPYALFQSSLPNLNTSYVRCSVDYSSVGHICTLTIERATTNTTFANLANSTRSLVTPSFNPFYIKVRFLSSGSVLSLSTIEKLNPDPSIAEYRVETLTYGGYVLTAYNQSLSGNLSFYLYLFDGSDNLVRWELPEPQSTNFAGAYKILSNNTLLLPQAETTNSWRLLVNDLPKFNEYQDHGYRNFQVNLSNPEINSTVLSNISSISITYYDQVDLSQGNLTIYQFIDSDNAIVRQIVSGDSQFCTLSPDGKTVTINVISSTFNAPGQQYYVQVDNNFVRSKSLKEPLLGVQARDTQGLLRLTPSGTQLFHQMNSSSKAAFFASLKSQLSQMIPVKLDRLSSSENSQVINSGTPSEQAVISITISEPKNNTERNVPLVIQDLNTMIQNSDITMISNGNATRYLDRGYGFIVSPNLFEKYKIKLVGLFVALCLFIVLFLGAQRKEPNGQNFAILQLGLIVFDLAIHLLFVINNSKDIPWLFIPSVVFLVVPVVLNTLIAFWIIMEENSNPRFFAWFNKNGKVASIFTLLAASDIEALTILRSNVAGFRFFQAPFSKIALSRIFWTASLNIFLEDIPRVVIQAIYFNYTVQYDLIPLLTLVSSCITLLVNLIGRTYEGVYRIRHHGVPSQPNSDDEDDNFGGSKKNMDVKEKRRSGSGKNNEKDEYNKYSTPGDNYAKDDYSWTDSVTRASTMTSNDETRVSMISGDNRASRSIFRESFS
ncbi:756_t:CDS:2, partial [Cetraspora pellucida]